MPEDGVSSCFLRGRPVLPVDSRRVVRAVALLVCVHAARLAWGAEDLSAPPRLTPSGLSVVAGRHVFVPTLTLPGEVRSTHWHDIVSHYCYWMIVGWMADEASAVAAGDPVASVFNETVETRVAERKRDLRRGKVREGLSRARFELAEMTDQQTVRAADIALRRARIRLEALDEGPLEGDLQLAQLACERCRLERDAAATALTRAKGLAEKGLTARESARELDHKHRLAEAQLKKAKADLAVLTHQPGDAELLDTRRAVTQAESALESAREAAAAARALHAANLAQAERAGEVQQAALDHWLGCQERETRRAPMAGIVVRPPIYVGGKARPGVGPLWTATIAQVLDPSQWAFVARAGEDEVAQISVGQPVELSIPGLPGRTLAGTVAAVGATADDLSRTAQFANWEERPDAGVNVYDVVIAVDHAAGLNLPQNMSGEAVIALAEARTVLLVPQACLREAADSRWALVRRGGAWLPQAVEVAGEHNGMAVIAAGLEPGDEVAILSD